MRGDLDAVFVITYFEPASMIKVPTSGRAVYNPDIENRVYACILYLRR